jgi:hypothetical protein
LSTWPAKKQNPFCNQIDSTFLFQPSIIGIWVLQLSRRTVSLFFTVVCLAHQARRHTHQAMRQALAAIRLKSGADLRKRLTF